MQCTSHARGGTSPRRNPLRIDHRPQSNLAIGTLPLKANLPIIYRFLGPIYRFSMQTFLLATRQPSDRRAYSSTNRKPIHRNRKPDGQRFIGGGIAAGGELSDNRPMVRPKRQICCLLNAYRNIRHLPGWPEQSSGDRWKEHDL
jgi:hypothetical protein